MIIQYFAPIDPRRPSIEVIFPHGHAILAASHISLEMCFAPWLFRFANFDCIEVIFTLHWRCILCYCEYFLSQTFFALKTRWWCSCVVLNWRIGPWTPQMKICPNVLTVLHWSTKKTLHGVFSVTAMPWHTVFHYLNINCRMLRRICLGTLIINLILAIVLHCSSWF